MITESISAMDCAFSSPDKPNTAFRRIMHGINVRPLLKAARKEATLALPIDWNNILPYIVTGINTRDIQYQCSAVVPMVITSGSFLNKAINASALKYAVTDNSIMMKVPALKAKKNPSLTLL